MCHWHWLHPRRTSPVWTLALVSNICSTLPNSFELTLICTAACWVRVKYKIAISQTCLSLKRGGGRAASSNAWLRMSQPTICSTISYGAADENVATDCLSHPTSGKCLMVLAELNYQLTHNLSSNIWALNAHKPSQLINFGTQITLPLIWPFTVTSASLSTAFPVRVHQ